MALLKYYRTSRDRELPASFFAERGIPQGLVPILQKALRKEPESRYQSAEEVERDLARAQETLETSGAQAEACYRLGMERWMTGQLQDAIEHFEQIPPGTAEFLDAQPALVKLYDQQGNRYFTRLRLVRAIKSWSASDRIERSIRASIDES